MGGRSGEKSSSTHLNSKKQMKIGRNFQGQLGWRRELAD